MCTETNKNVNKPTSNNLEKEVKEQDKSLNLASISNAPHVLLQTLKVKIKDNLITSLDNEAEILPFIEEIYHILADGKFNLRGWKYTGDDPEQVTSVLGLIWNRKEDAPKINLDWLETYKLEIV
ncbi:uncharacterized protein TNCT_574621 [Trichonephila clavata]|uniref:Uncharacterized protein n=1 Tax=Trichonephila clavata TaxID=2740835 RepID=A0A8X6LKY2_TRICU|nr:uncharacterized protein TNCT_574621 [Trichonephila clavata]